MSWKRVGSQLQASHHIARAATLDPMLHAGLSFRLALNSTSHGAANLVAQVTSGQFDGLNPTVKPSMQKPSMQQPYIPRF